MMLVGPLWLRGYRVGYGEPDSDLETLDRWRHAEQERRDEAQVNR
jgi:hypothetical protein